jgi:hypothetical protein
LVETRAYRPARNIFEDLRGWPKKLSDFGSWEAHFTGIARLPINLAAEDPFRPDDRSYYATVGNPASALR